ncbi:MAG: hypothetical protein F4W95_10515 [Chloroflexi bacterium]|nr:hypothetical protein [Chloroflexota bacterium]MXZ90448.1 hypothetical protein [Chloroflexota bacterium]MYD48905.1 hypothetical protein [Chloroflexota bacterium]
MVKTLNDDDDSTLGADCDPGIEQDAPLLDLLDAMVDERGRAPAAGVLGVNYRTLALCCDSRQVSRRMRRALVDFRDRGVDGGGETDLADDGSLDEGVAVLRQRVAELEDENAELRKLADDQALQLEELTRRLAALEDGRQSEDADELVDADADDKRGNDQSENAAQDWRPPRRKPGMPGAGVVTLEEQPDEALAFGPATALVAEWRQLRTGGGQVASRVDRAQAAVRRWELEAAMIGEYRLTLPPDTYPLDDGRRADHVRWRRDALAEAQRELRKAKRARLLRRFLTMGMSRK